MLKSYNVHLCAIRGYSRNWKDGTMQEILVNKWQSTFWNDKKKSVTKLALHFFAEFFSLLVLVYHILCSWGCIHNALWAYLIPWRAPGVFGGLQPSLLLGWCHWLWHFALPDVLRPALCTHTRDPLTCLVYMNSQTSCTVCAPIQN